MLAKISAKKLFVFTLLVCWCYLLFFNSIHAEFKKNPKLLLEKAGFQQMRDSEVTSQSMQRGSRDSARCVYGLAGPQRLRKLKGERGKKK